MHAWDGDVDWSSFDGVVVRSTWDYVDRRDEFLAWTESLPRVANPAPVIRWNSHKRYLADLASRGTSIVPTVWPRDGDAIPRDWSDIVVKPAVSSAGRWTGRFSDVDDATAFAQTLLDRGEDVLAQPYVASVDAIGETGVFFFGGRVSHAIRKGPILHRDAEPRPDSSLAGGQTSESLALADAPVAFAQSVLDAIDERLLYARVDCVRDADGNDVVIEVELVEPYFFLTTSPAAAVAFAAAVVAWLDAP